MKRRTTNQAPWSRGEAARPPRRSGGGGGNPLSRDQKAALCQLARIAFERHDALGLIHDELLGEAAGGSASARFAEWRRMQQRIAVGRDSLTECRNGHYRTLRAHFSLLAGREDKAYRDLTRTGRVKDRGAAADTHENRETMRRLILEELLAHGHRCDPRRTEFDPAISAVVEKKGGIINQHYVISIAKMKCRGRKLDSLTAGELEQILYTVRNRIAAREGRGKTGSRNKSQRRRA